MPVHAQVAIPILFPAMNIFTYIYICAEKINMFGVFFLQSPTKRSTIAVSKMITHYTKSILLNTRSLINYLRISQPIKKHLLRS